MEDCRTVLLISGMRSNSCRDRISAILEEIEGVNDVHVNLFRAVATVSHRASCDPEDLVRAIFCAGYGAAVDGRFPPRRRPLPGGRPVEPKGDTP